MKHTFIIILLAALTTQPVNAQDLEANSLTYLKQPPPGLTPQIFAPGVVSKEDEHEFGSVFSADGTEFFYAVDVNGKAEIRHTKLEDDQWSTPELLIHHDRYGYNDPFLSPDEQRLYFISDQPLRGTGPPKDIDIWYAEREGDRWSSPINAGPTINSDSNEYYISFTQTGTLYFSSNTKATTPGDFDIYTATWADGQFQPPRRMSDAINTTAYEADVFVAYDDSYLIFCAERKEGYGQGDLYISFRRDDGTWSASKNMGDVINTEQYEFCPFVTKDNRHLFYTSQMDIYWVDASIIDQFR